MNETNKAIAGGALKALEILKSAKEYDTRQHNVCLLMHRANGDYECDKCLAWVKGTLLANG